MGSEDGTGDADNTEFSERVQCLKNKSFNNRVVIANGNCATEETHSESVNDGVEIVDGNYATEEARRLKNEAMSNVVAFADGNGVIEEARPVKSEAISNGVAVADVLDYAAEGDSTGIEVLQTYKRRKHVKSSSKSKVQDGCRECVEPTSHAADQVVKEPSNVALGNTSDDYSHGYWGNVVLKHLYQSLGDDSGGLKGCVREALIHHPKSNCATTVMETFKIGKDGQEYSSQFKSSSHRTQSEANGHANNMYNGFPSETHGHGVTEMCQLVLCNILTSEKFSSLCKALHENFQGVRPENVFDFSVVNSRMKEEAYEQSPTLFLSDIQQVWKKLQDTGNEIVALTKSLSNMSRTSYCNLVGITAQSTFENEKQVFNNLELDSHVKPELPEECAMHKICSCRRCGDKADDTECLVCDSCEEMYHVSCIKPAVKEIPHKSWYCANCIASGIGSPPHENCVVCERLSEAKTLNNVIGDESSPTDEETLYECEDNSNCTYDGIQAPKLESETECKICGNEVGGEKVRMCGHPFCPNKYYHIRCLTSTQLKSYGPYWYCASCLCRVCFSDQDDDKVVLCDGCNHAYHIYCMKPPRTSIPKGKWFCRKCDTGLKAIHQAQKVYVSNKPKTGKDVLKPNGNLPKRGKSKRVQSRLIRTALETGGGMDMLLTAANTLKFEENLGTVQIDSHRT